MEQSLPPSLDDLSLFVRVAQDRSFSKAAAALGMPKATLSRRLANLERDLGVALLVRTTRSVDLTAPGRALLADAEAALAALARAADRVRGTDPAPRGRLRLAAPVEFGERVIAPLVADFLAAAPEVAVELELTDRAMDLGHDACDVAVRWGPASAEGRHGARALGVVQHGLFASPGWVGAHGAPRYAHDLAELDALVLAEDADRARWTLTDGAQTLTVALRPRLRASHQAAVLAAACAGLGIARLADFVAAPELASGRLVRVLPGWGGPEVPVHAAFPDPRLLAPATRACLEFLAARLVAPEAA